MEDSFQENRRGSIVTKFAIAAGLIVLFATFAGASVEQMARTGNLPMIALLEPNQYVATKVAGSAGVDFTPTGSISGRIVLNPCSAPQTTP
jgi:hypothetical protein